MTKYSIEQFSQITGITKFVLRTWENRYGFLKAERTDTKIRYYTDELLVRALNSNYLLENGYKIHENPSQIGPNTIKIHPKSTPGARPR